MDRLISQEKTIRDLRGIKDVLVAAGDPFQASVINGAIKCVENQVPVDGNCHKCRWKNRHQKCTCCRRNSSMKDCYEEENK